MAIVVEDGTGLPNAQVMTSVAEANAYFAARGEPQPVVATMEAALGRGWQYIENAYRGRWKGRNVYELQTLAWPRRGVIDEEGFEIQPNIVPKLVKSANAHAALLRIQGIDLEASASATTTLTRETNKVGDVSSEKQYATAASQRNSGFLVIDSYLSGLVISKPGADFGMVRLIRG
jgi:hypothetical protein